jgi:threonylcarbamoyladenosine tRNA methylthiotransferase MtaB
MALQSGSDPVLKRMGRGYTTMEFESAVADAREAIGDVAITTDVIVGFPGESHQEFEDSFQFCQEIWFSGLHIFQYSARPGTAAANMPGSIPAKIKKARSLSMLELAERCAANFRHKFTGTSMPVLWESSKGENIWMGHTSNYLKVMARSDESLADQIVMTRLGQENGDGIWGEIC